METQVNLQTANGPTVQIWTVDISPEECTELLASPALGRLGAIVEGRPEIVPVGHVFDPESGSVLVHTSGQAELESALNWPWVAFEIDGVDTATGSRWSVAVVGAAERVGERCARIRPAKVTGRRITTVAH